MKYVIGYIMLEIRYVMFFVFNYICFEIKKFI